MRNNTKINSEHIRHVNLSRKTSFRIIFNVLLGRIEKIAWKSYFTIDQ